MKNLTISCYKKNHILMDHTIDIIPCTTAPLTLNISDREQIIICGKGSEDKIILELKNKLTYSVEGTSDTGGTVGSTTGSTTGTGSTIESTDGSTIESTVGSTIESTTGTGSTIGSTIESTVGSTTGSTVGSTTGTVGSTTGSTVGRDSLIVTSKSIYNKTYHDWKKDEAHDFATGYIEIRGVRLSPEERKIVLGALSPKNGVDKFIKIVRPLKGVFLLDQDLLSLVIERYNTDIYTIIEKLNFSYHLCYLSEQIYHILHNKNERLSDFQEVVEKSVRGHWYCLMLTSGICIMSVIAMIFIAIYLKK